MRVSSLTMVPSFSTYDEWTVDSEQYGTVQVQSGWFLLERSMMLVCLRPSHMRELDVCVRGGGVLLLKGVMNDVHTNKDMGVLE